MNRLSVLKYDIVSIALYIGLVSFGIINIYSSSFNESFTNLFDVGSIVGKQVIFFSISNCIHIYTFYKSKFIDNSTSIVYFLSIILLVGLFIFGVERGEQNHGMLLVQ